MTDYQYAAVITSLIVKYTAALFIAGGVGTQFGAPLGCIAFGVTVLVIRLVP